MSTDTMSHPVTVLNSGLKVQNSMMNPKKNTIAVIHDASNVNNASSGHNTNSVSDLNTTKNIRNFGYDGQRTHFRYFKDARRRFSIAYRYNSNSPSTSSHKGDHTGVCTYGHSIFDSKTTNPTDQPICLPKRHTYDKKSHRKTAVDRLNDPRKSVGHTFEFPYREEKELFAFQTFLNDSWPEWMLQEQAMSKQDPKFKARGKAAFRAEMDARWPAIREQPDQYQYWLKRTLEIQEAYFKQDFLEREEEYCFKTFCRERWQAHVNDHPEQVDFHTYETAWETAEPEMESMTVRNAWEKLRREFKQKCREEWVDIWSQPKNRQEWWEKTWEARTQLMRNTPRWRENYQTFEQMLALAIRRHMTTHPYPKPEKEKTKAEKAME